MDKDTPTTRPSVITENFDRKISQALEGKTQGRQREEQSEVEENSIQPYTAQQQTLSADDDAHRWLLQRRETLQTILAREEAKKQVHKLATHNLTIQDQEKDKLTVGPTLQPLQPVDKLTKQASAKPIVPEKVAKAYVELDGKFYFTHRPTALAFVDKGDRLQTKLSNARVASSMVDIAEARGWAEIQLKGTRDFRREAWLAAAARGMAVRGYKPREEDLVHLKKLTHARPANEVFMEEQVRKAFKNSTELSQGRRPENTAEPPGTQNPSAPGQVEIDKKGESPRKDAFQKNEPVDRFAGTIVDHGKAPYVHNPNNQDSYYVTLENADRQQSTTWGVDLERAIHESGAKKGDSVALQNRGSRPISVERPVKDEKGNVVGTKTIHTHRNEWEVKAAALQDTNRDAKDIVREHPDLVNEVAVLKVAEKFSRRFDREAVGAYFMDKIRKQLASNVAKGQAAPQIKLREEQVSKPMPSTRGMEHER